MKKIKDKFYSYINFRNLFLATALFYFFWSQGPIWLSHWKMEGTKVKLTTVLDLSGQETILPLSPNHPYILIFWATWCEPCSIELNRFSEAINKNELDGNFVYAVNTGEDVATVIQHAREKKFPFKVFLDPNQMLMRLFHVRATPTVIHVNADETIQWVTSGMSPTGIVRAQKHLTSHSL